MGSAASWTVNIEMYIGCRVLVDTAVFVRLSSHFTTKNKCYSVAEDVLRSFSKSTEITKISRLIAPFV